MDIQLSKSQSRLWDELKQALVALEEQFDKIKKFNYDKRYNVLLQSENEWRKYDDPISGKKMDLSIKLQDFEGSDLEVLDEINSSSTHAQLRRNIMSKEKIEAIKNNAKWQKLYTMTRDLEEEWNAFWLTVDEIKKQRSTEIRNAFVMRKTINIVHFRTKVEVFYKEGRHRERGQALSYEYALNESISNLDSNMKLLNGRKFGSFKENT